MIDYNAVLSDKEKSELLEQLIGKEKDKFNSIMCDMLDEADVGRRLAALEEYYNALKEINNKFFSAGKNA